ncbi:MAG: hypothetical protein JXQ29_12025 [Planctomycetes bacterium]|nr:hypothetical protein [Planctomycetota bacterium]
MREKTAVAVLGGAMLLVLLAMLLAGRLAPERTLDTDGYLLFGPLVDSLSAIRSPLYGWWLFAATFGTLDFTLVPALHTLLFFAAVLVLFSALRALEVSPAAALAVTLPLVFSNLLLRWNRAIHPEVPAGALFLLAVAFLLRMAAQPRCRTSLLGFALALGGACLLRPVFLPAMVLLPLAFLVLGKFRDRPRVWAATAAVLLAGALPLVAVSTLRLALVGDFHVVSFGGFQMSGLATQILTPDIARRLPADVRPLAERVLARREQAIAEGKVLAIPRNSRHKRSYLSVALQYFDCFARNYNYLLYEVNEGLREPGEGQVRFNRRMQRYALAVVAHAPREYAAWIVGAATRSAGHMTVTNLPFLVLLACVAMACPIAALRRRHRARNRPPSIPAEPPDRDALPVVVVTIAYTLSAGLLMIVASSPEMRYIETAGLLLPALPGLALVRMLRGRA